ncbi:phosphonate ABC transporter, permease protein PhnE [Comamonas kerstersii]|uniref:Phosphonate ABC transporter, permease protein PhnE n=1 Tax=Comamonas kerstersii TaxID=225992 RepID=A0A1V3TKM9_9BURK|nr:phosphonate ABC transporter, permease protein PhnE [Comamonas kerstersii]AQZ98297.1 phosphonate ABC transporter, permease protein PhnE [Comamonas kerstersii]OOH86810.1 phosphonate ABC transporter, permease protein PhnE [Comamonas kerstersii]OOH90178.1 phosphonate ABC transporter, permease protein PhnE [Comamonas kerstersii]
MAGVSRHDTGRKAFTLGWSQKALIALTVVYVLWSLSTMGVSAERLSAGWVQGARFIAQMFPPEMGKMEELWQGIKETLQIAVLATVIGLLLSLPVGLMSASNMAPAPVRAVGRTIIAVCRALHPVISAILFVKAVGFGPLAGILALVVATVGFVGKLFADAIEEISPKPIEAIRATGASFMNVVLFGVLPQVISRFVGFSTYQLDSNLRNSTMVGIVGAGGIGGVLFAAFLRYEYNFVFTILFTVIAIIVVGELVVGAVRKALNV